MKKLSLILVALATMVMVGCKPLTSDGECVHDWVDTDDTKVTSAKYYLNDKGELTFKTVEVSPKYKCSICGEEHEKTYAFFDSPTTIGVATGVNETLDMSTGLYVPNLSLDTWSVEKYNSYYGDSSIKYKCSCDDCDNNCSGDSCGCQKLTCVRIIHNPDNDMYFFGDYYITVPNN